MVVQSRVFVQMEIAVLPDALSQDAPVAEVDTTPEADTVSDPPGLHHFGGKVIQKIGRLLQLTLIEGAEEVLQDVRRSRLVLGQERSSLRCEGELHCPPIGGCLGPADESSPHQPVHRLAGGGIADSEKVRHVTDPTGIGPGYELEDLELGGRNPVIGDLSQLLLHPFINGRGEDSNTSKEIVYESHLLAPCRGVGFPGATVTSVHRIAPFSMNITTVKYGGN